MATHILAVVLPAIVIASALRSFSFFSWHPICMIVAYGFVMTEAIMIFSPESSLVQKASRSTKVNYHGYLLGCALLVALAGFAVIYSNKNRLGKAHFTSPHGVGGAVTLAYTCAQAAAGVALKNHARLPALASVGSLKLAHALSGGLLYLLACLTVLGGLNSGWFVGAAHEYVWAAANVAALLLLLVGVAHVMRMLQDRLAGAQRDAKRAN